MLKLAFAMPMSVQAFKHADQTYRSSSGLRVVRSIVIPPSHLELTKILTLPISLAPLPKRLTYTTHGKVVKETP